MYLRSRSVQWTAIVLSAGFCCIALYSYLVARHRILWSDELFGWMLLHDSSMSRMLSNWRAGADGGGPVFYLLGRFWIACFGKSDIAFRAFSAAGCFVAFSFSWFALRRTYRPSLLAITLFLVWFGSRTILWQMVQTRFYGLMLCAASFALYVTIRSARETADGQPASRNTLKLNLLAHALLVGTHPFGVVYSGFILLGSALSDLIHWRPIHRWPRVAFYLTGILPWCLLWVSREAMHNSSRMGKPHFWTTTPNVNDLSSMYLPVAAPVIGYVAAAFLLITLTWPARRRAFWQAEKERSHVVFPALILSMTPMFFWLVSQRGTSYFVDRYMIPFSLGIAVLSVEALTLILPCGILAAPNWVKLMVGGWMAYLIFCVSQDSLISYPATLVVPPRDFTNSLAAKLPRNIPIVFERVDMFDVMIHQQGAPDLPMFYLLDWDTAIDPKSPRGIVSGYWEMKTWKQVGYNAQSIQESDSFLRTNSDFIVVDDAKVLWFEKRILNNPTWEVQKLDDYKNGFWSETIWRVHHR